MSKKTMILVAVTALMGGTINPKTKETEPASVAAGDELTAERLEALGLDDKAVTDLIARGHIAEVEARVAEPVDGAEDTTELQGKLDAETKRADEAEAKVKDLEKQLADAAKAAKPAAGAQA